MMTFLLVSGSLLAIACGLSVAAAGHRSQLADAICAGAAALLGVAAGSILGIYFVSRQRPQTAGDLVSSFGVAAALAVILVGASAVVTSMAMKYTQALRNR